MTTKKVPALGDLRVWWIPQIPCKAYHVPVSGPEEAAKVMQILADYDLFQLKHHIKPDYANAGGLEVYVADYDGTQTPGWNEWYDDEDRDIDEWAREQGGVTP